MRPEFQPGHVWYDSCYGVIETFMDADQLKCRATRKQYGDHVFTAPNPGWWAKLQYIGEIPKPEPELHAGYHFTFKDGRSGYITKIDQETGHIQCAINNLCTFPESSIRQMLKPYP